MKKTKLDVVVVTYKTPFLAEVVIKSFRKFCPSDIELRFVFVENSDFDLSGHLERVGINGVVVTNNLITSTFSEAHGSGLEASKHLLSEDTDYVITCHSDTCVTSTSFFEEVKRCITDGVDLAGVCEDRHEARVRALHCSGLFVSKKIFESVSLMPQLPRIDTADLLTVWCRENGKKIRLWRNTYNDENLVDACNSPFRELGKGCGMDRCLDSQGNVMFIHQGRGTSKYTGSYSNEAKVMTKPWLEFCRPFCQ